MGSDPGDSTDATIIQVQRRRLFRASAVAEICRHACASRYDDFDPDHLAGALWVVYELIEDVADVLERFAGDGATQKQDDFDPLLIVDSLRTDAALLLQHHPQLNSVHAQLLRAAAVIETLARRSGD